MTKEPKTKLCNGSSDSDKHKIANDTCWSLIANANYKVVHCTCSLIYMSPELVISTDIVTTANESGRY